MASFPEMVAELASGATDDVLVAKMAYQLQALTGVEPDQPAMVAFAVGAAAACMTAVGYADEMCGVIPAGSVHPILRPHEAGAIIKLCSELAAAFAKVAEQAMERVPSGA